MINLRSGFSSVLLCAAFAFSPCVMAQSGSGSIHIDDGARKMMKSQDATFAMKAAQGGMAEVRLGQLALEKSTNPEVKSFGQKMVDDHSKANKELKAAAEKDGMTLPKTMSAKDEALYQKLSQLSGSSFDKAYMKAMVKDHEEDVKQFQNEANSGTNAGIKNFASTTLPTLQEHLQLAKSTEQKVNVSA